MNLTASEIETLVSKHLALRQALIFMAEQGCEGDGEYEQCSDLPNNPCVTEYCLPCYANWALKVDDAENKALAELRALRDSL